jgi:molybdenum cofactor guanylyltransferase
MGRDKALLPYRGTTLVGHIAGLIQQSVGRVAVVGDPERYRSLGYPVHADRVPFCGPLGGIYTALSVTAQDWNLVVACDMPLLSADVFGTLLAACSRSSAGCVAAAGPAGELEPLCAIYHRRCRPVLERAIREERFRMRDWMSQLEAEPVAVDASALANINTPAEWVRVETSPR